MAEERRGLTPTEWLEKYGPVFDRMKAQITPCIEGLTTYAASLALEGRMNDVAMLRKRIDAMSGFWFGGAENHVERFDRAIAEAKSTGHCEQLSDEQKAAVEKGVEVNIRQMERDLDDVETLDEFDELSEWLGSQWSPEAQIRADFGGMTFG